AGGTMRHYDAGRLTMRLFACRTENARWQSSRPGEASRSVMAHKPALLSDNKRAHAAFLWSSPCTVRCRFEGNEPGFGSQQETAASAYRSNIDAEDFGDVEAATDSTDEHGLNHRAATCLSFRISSTALI